MEALFIIIGIPIFVLTLIMIFGTMIRFVKSFKHHYEPMKSPRDNDPNRPHPLSYFNYNIAPAIISVFAPIGGFFITLSASPHTQYDDLFYTPINHDHLLTIVVFYIMAVVSFWVSQMKENQLSPLMHSFVILGMAQGIILCIFLAIQFGGFMVFGLMPIVITFPLLSPFLFALLLFIEIRRQYYLQKQKILKQEEDVVYESLVLSTAEKVVKSDVLENPFLFFLLIPFIALQQTILILFGQQPDSFIRAFVDTCTYTFSQFDPPPNPDLGGHYLCTMASRGNPKLVKPLRKGIRGGKIIDVNRQLMISNAFEEWLEQHTPVFHRYLRGFYNKVGKPLNDMVQSRNISNLMFLIMKPLEWFFLLWLYIFDRCPENRIHRQYLPLQLK